MTITLLDVSHHQRPVDWRKAKAAGVQGAYIKVSQGRSHRDEAAKQHYDAAKAAGLLTGFYHFCTNDNGIEQYENFKNAANAIGKTDLPPALDCEAYTSINGVIYSENDIEELLSHGRPYSIVIGADNAYLYDQEDLLETYALTYPSQDVVDVIGRRLLKNHPDVAIYTNIGSGNRIFTKPVFGTRYKLWVAHWGVDKPSLPAVWKGKPYMCWQKGVYPGEEYGVDGKIDVNEWGTAIPWPGAVEPEPPEPPAPSQPAIIRIKQGDKWREFREVE